ncbi:unnamed protein product [Sphagnum jensenii]|uniref:Uncharacterized protein n=1 Tax=Sphagnum jensenii TaxID=128206 RepID=A0ABP1BSA7_9BRYO
MAESLTAEVKENPSLRARPKARVDKPEQPSAEKQKKSKNSENAATDDEQLGRLQPACLGIGVAVVLASIILYLATPPGPMKPGCFTGICIWKLTGAGLTDSLKGLTASEVWCNSGHYPRIVERVAELPRKGPPGTRCACFEEDELKRPGLRVYESCYYYSNKCNTS